MKLSFISPTPYIKTLGVQSDFNLVLSHLLDRHYSNDYERAIMDTELSSIIDNGLFENGRPEGIDEVITKGLRIQATHFFAPDYLYDQEQTLRALNDTIHVWRQRRADKHIKIAVVVQGKTEEEWFEMYDKLQEMNDVDLIGLSILSIPRCFGSWNSKSHSKNETYIHKDSEITSSRIKLLKKLLERGNNKKNCHLLGLGDSYEDVIFAAKNCPFVVSNDTSSPIWNGFQNKAILEDGSIFEGKTEVKVDFNYDQANKGQIKLAQYNIKKIKSLI